MREETARWIAQDKAHAWHPFTQQNEWCDDGHEPLVLCGGEGAWLIDSEGRRYLDGNSSIWTNIHGHTHPRLTRALQDQAQKVAHTSYLGFANPVASEIAARLCGYFPQGTLERCFFSDDGSTAIECALKMSLQYRQQTGAAHKTGFIAFDGAYHGDTFGAASLGGVGRFFDRFAKLGMPVERVADLTALKGLPDDVLETMTAVIIEPIIQGVNVMTPWPQGMLAELREWCDAHGLHLILDEVMTGFGRTGTLFACQQEEVIPDFLCLAKGLSGGYVPLAATLTTQEMYQAFEGDKDKVFYYGHSFTGNQIGCAVALASLEVFQEEQTLEKMKPKVELFKELLSRLDVAAVRSVGLIAGVDLKDDQGTGADVCLKMREYGVLTRPILNTIVLMPPLCISAEELELLVGAVAKSLPRSTG